jgi:hypothetical protein
MHKTCYYFNGCDRFSKKQTPTPLYQLIAPDCFGCRLISEQISCPPDWRILKKNGDYCIQRKDRLWIFSKWTYIRKDFPWGEAIRWFRTAYEAYVEIEELIKEIEKKKIRLAEEAKKRKEAKKVWKKENGVVCGDK